MNKGCRSVLFLAILSWVAADDTDVETLLDRAIGLQLKGDQRASRELYGAVLLKRPGHVLALNNLAAMHHQNGENAKARVLLERAFNTGGRNSSGDLSLSDLATSYNTYGVVLRALGDMESSRLSMVESLSLQPHNPYAHLNLASLLHYGRAEGALRGHLEEAVEHYRLALDQDVGGELDRVTVLNDFGLALMSLGRLEEAVTALEGAVTLAPTSLQSRGNLAIALKELGMLSLALEQAEKAHELAPRDPRLLYNIGLLWRELSLEKGDDEACRDKARAFLEQAVRVDPGLYHAWSTMGHMEGQEGHLEAARGLYQRAYGAALDAGPMAGGEVNSLRLQAATAILPIIYHDTQQMKHVRNMFLRNLQALLSLPQPYPTIPDPLTSMGSAALGYYLLYQGQPDLPPRRLLAQVYRKSCPSLVAPPLPPPQPSPRLRVGFLSAFWYRHSVGLLLEGVMAHLDPALFEVSVLFVQPQPSDDLSRAIRASAARAVDLPRNLEAAQRTIQSLALDLLVFGEVGMDGMTYFLAFARLAPVQVAFWGHAVTSGITAMDDPSPSRGGIDWFISSSSFEPHDVAAQSRYTERLYLMEGLTTHFRRPIEPPPLTRQSLGLPVTGPLYVVPQTLYKVHPDFDGMLRELLGVSPTAHAVFLEGRSKEWARQFRTRLLQSLGPSLMSRVVILGRLSFQEYGGLCRLADVVLDPFPVGGGRSSFEILAVGTPIVVLYPRTSILQLTAAMYRAMELPPWLRSLLVTASPHQYIAAAFALAHNGTLRASASAAILANNHRLYEQEQVVTEWSKFLHYIVKQPAASQAAPVAIASRDIPQQQEEPSSGVSMGWVRLGAWGFEAAIGGPPRRGPPPTYAIKVRAEEAPGSQQHKSFLVEVPPQADPVAIARGFCEHIQAEQVKCAFITRALQLGAMRSRLPIAWEGHLDASTGRVKVDVRYGEDLAQVAYWHALRLGLDPLAIMEVLMTTVPQHEQPHWLRAREQYLNLPIAPIISGAAYDDGITLAVTTCKRLALFKRTMGALEKVLGTLPGKRIERVIIVDDASSIEDRHEVLRQYPNFYWVFKPPELSGHASSLNEIVRLTRSRYLLYLEDDWELIGREGDSFLEQALEILRASQAPNSGVEGVSQVLFNGQSSRACAHAKLQDCQKDPNKDRGAWPRQVGQVSYNLHEFGSMHPSHDFSYWPGLSLNPGLWDLQQIQGAMGTGDMFNESDARFEQSWSLRCYDRGLRMAHLVMHSFSHIGTEESAYVANGQWRPWDSPKAIPAA